MVSTSATMLLLASVSLIVTSLPLPAAANNLSDWITGGIATFYGYGCQGVR